MNNPGSLTKDDRTDIRAYQKKHGLKVDGNPGHQTVPHMLALIADLGRKMKTYAFLAFIAGLVIGSAVSGIFQ